MYIWVYVCIQINECIFFNSGSPAIGLDTYVCIQDTFNNLLMFVRLYYRV